MIKYSVMYPNIENGTFDHDYYRDVHLPLIEKRMGDYCLAWSIEKIITSPGESPAPYVAGCHIFCASLEDLEKGMAEHADELVADVANFSNITPVKWLSEVVESTDPQR